jgi:two-component system, NtrC family, sensor kinase
MLTGAEVPAVRKRLAVQLTVSLTLLIAMTEGVTAYVNVRIQERQLLDGMILGADQLSRSITSATWHAMLADDREAAYEVMQTIATKQGIDWIRIFNKEGRIMFSTRPEYGRMVDKNGEACFVCHAKERPLVRVDVPSRARSFHDPSGSRRLGLITPIYNEPSCSSAPCHAHAANIAVLGILDVGLDLTPVDREMTALQWRAGGVLAAELALLAAFVSFFARRFVQKPIRKLIAGTRAVSEMDLDRPIVIESSEELEELARSFNAMRERLKLAMAEIHQATAQLESRVQERTAQLEAAQHKLIQADRLASLGQLAASVAHEINNPLTGVLNLSALMQRIVRTDGIPAGREEEFRAYLAQVSSETARASRIVSDLLAFARRSKSREEAADLNVLVRKTVALVDHKLRLLGVEVETRLDERMPLVPCDASQIQQVILNLVLNAAEASPRGGRVELSTQASPGTPVVTLVVEDRGSGILPEHLPRIFDPFFTTKDEGKGVGLGLAVVYGIVQSHAGDIEVDSAPGRGTRFTVMLPLHPPPRVVTPAAEPVAGTATSPAPATSTGDAATPPGAVEEEA